MKLTGTHEYINPEINKQVVQKLIAVNCSLHDTLLCTAEKWTVEDAVCEQLRMDAEMLAIFLMRRIAQFARFRTEKQREEDKQAKKDTKKRKKDECIQVVAEDLNFAWDSVQMDRLK